VAALLERAGPAILFVHSNAGEAAWLTTMRSSPVKAVVAFEPGSGFPFPEGEVAAPVKTSLETVAGVPVAKREFASLTRVPIVIYYGDNIPAIPSDIPTLDAWRGRLAMARLWRDAVNRHGGDVMVVHLPEIGKRGNTHFPFSDLNDNQVAREVSQFLRAKRQD